MIKQKHTNINVKKMNAGEQSFYHMPFTIRLYTRTTSSNSLEHKKDKLKITQRQNVVMEKIFFTY